MWKMGTCGQSLSSGMENIRRNGGSNYCMEQAAHPTTRRMADWETSETHTHTHTRGSLEDLGLCSNQLRLESSRPPPRGKARRAFGRKSWLLGCCRWSRFLFEQHAPSLQFARMQQPRGRLLSTMARRRVVDHWCVRTGMRRHQDSLVKNTRERLGPEVVRASGRCCF